MKTALQLVGVLYNFANFLESAGVRTDHDPDDLRKAAEMLETQRNRIFVLENASSPTKSDSPAKPAENAAELSVDTLRLVSWAKVCQDIQPDNSDIHRYLTKLGYTFDKKVGTLVSVWDALKAYMNMHGCDPRVLKALSQADYVVVWAQ